MKIQQGETIYSKALTIADLYAHRRMNQKDIADKYRMPKRLVEKTLWEMDFYYGKCGFPNSSDSQRLFHPYVDCLKIQKLLLYENIPITPFEIVDKY